MVERRLAMSAGDLVTKSRGPRSVSAGEHRSGEHEGTWPTIRCALRTFVARCQYAIRSWPPGKIEMWNTLRANGGDLADGSAPRLLQIVVSQSGPYYYTL
jgi:hypothetical protein